MFHQSLFAVLLPGVLVGLASCGGQQGSPTLAPRLPNPASVYCEQHGGKVDLRQDAAGGVAGICVFPDGSECDEWAFFRGECKPGNEQSRPGTRNTPTPARPEGAGSVEIAADGWKVYRNT
jgi:putative hemolysin